MTTIKHTVFFKLKHAPGSAGEARFLELAMALASIAEVGHLECVRQVGKKNDFDWGLLMDFASQADHERYNAHPEHVKFVAEHWLPDVEHFIELDYVARA